LNFGLLDNVKVNENSRENFLALPYKAAKKPLKGSQFTSIEITIAFTIISFLINKLRKDDINVILKYLIDKTNGLNHKNAIKSFEYKFYKQNFEPFMKNNKSLLSFPVIDELNIEQFMKDE